MFLMAETLRRFKALETAGQVDDQAQCEWRVALDRSSEESFWG